MDEKNKSSKRLWIYLLVFIVLTILITLSLIYNPAIWVSIWFAIEEWMWLILSVTGILIGNKVLSIVIKRTSKKSKTFPKDAANGLVLIVRVISVFALLFIVLPALKIPSEYMVNISTILATAIGFASTIAVSNIVAGFYMIASRPYKIGDYIAIDGGIEGIVKEVGLNYTKLTNLDGIVYQIPNNKLFSSNITNFSLEPSLKQKEVSENMEHRLISVVSDIIIEKKNIVRYIFDIEISLDLDSKETITILDQLCDRWEEKLGYRPHYFFQFISWRGRIRWALIGDTPEIIMNNRDDFLEDIWFSIYKLKEEED